MKALLLNCITVHPFLRGKLIKDENTDNNEITQVAGHTSETPRFTVSSPEQLLEAYYCL